MIWLKSRIVYGLPKLVISKLKSRRLTLPSVFRSPGLGEGEGDGRREGEGLMVVGSGILVIVSTVFGVVIIF